MIHDSIGIEQRIELCYDFGTEIISRLEELLCMRLNKKNIFPLLTKHSTQCFSFDETATNLCQLFMRMRVCFQRFLSDIFLGQHSLESAQHVKQQQSPTIRLSQKTQACAHALWWNVLVEYLHEFFHPLVKQGTNTSFHVPPRRG